jgi:hypothetical protein
MRVLTVAVAMIVLMSSALVPAFAEEAKSPSQPQATPVQPERSTQQSEQSPQATGQPDTKSNQTTSGTSSERRASAEPVKMPGV